MSQSKFIIISEDPVVIEKAQRFSQDCGLKCEVQNPRTHNLFSMGLASGNKPVTPRGFEQKGNKIIPFPTRRSSVPKMDQLEAQAIEEAIYAYRGNLTEAARALGIGRATLYRKVKTYGIDTAAARRQRRAA